MDVGEFAFNAPWVHPWTPTIGDKMNQLLSSTSGKVESGATNRSARNQPSTSKPLNAWQIMKARHRHRTGTAIRSSFGTTQAALPGVGPNAVLTAEELALRSGYPIAAIFALTETKLITHTRVPNFGVLYDWSEVQRELDALKTRPSPALSRP